MLTGKKGRLSSEQAEAIKRDLQVPLVSMVNNTMRIKNDKNVLNTNIWKIIAQFKAIEVLKDKHQHLTCLDS